MIIKNAKFLCSSQKLSQCPPATIEGVGVVEVAFIGRSNVGKSSLINALTNNSDLAKVSSTPGKTRLINHFVVDNRWMLVDLPGYGYAKVGKSQRESFSLLIQDYVLKRTELYCLFVVVDIRHLPQKADVEFMRLLAQNEVPFAIAFSKADKLSPQAQQKAIDGYKSDFSSEWDEFPPYFLTSSRTKFGCDEILNYIEKMVLDNDENNNR